MKISKGLLFVFILIVFGFGCKKQDIPSTSGNIDPSLPTTNEAASTIVTALSTNNYGLGPQLANATAISQYGFFGRTQASNSLSFQKNSLSTTTSLCGLSRDTLFSITNPKTDSSKYKFTIAYYVQVNCTQNQPSNMVFVDSTSGSYYGNLLSYTGTSKCLFSSTLPTGGQDSTIIFNGTYTRKGTTISNFLNKSTFSTDITITYSDLTIGRNSHFISKGSASIEIAGASKTGKIFRYLGSADFSTPGQIKMVLEGHQYRFDILSGQAF